ncbi:MAG: WbqC-like protein family protein [Verrucomicrobia bacterium]|nr:MAG: WbqC-like protein family protein [Verrucomicrobiota bacterium]
MIVAIHQPQYLPWLPYFDKVDACDCFVYLDNVQFQKNGVQNRNQIKTPQGPAWLTVPLRASLNLNIRDTPIAAETWRKKHIRSIELFYARAPFLNLFADGLRPILDRDWTFLADLNIAVTDWMCNQLGIVSRRIRASDLHSHGAKDDLVIGICETLGATVYLSGRGAEAYQDPAKFARHGIELRYQDYKSQPYPQCFPALNFVPNLSALDLILNSGPEARSILLGGRPTARSEAEE